MSRYLILVSITLFSNVPDAIDQAKAYGIIAENGLAASRDVDKTRHADVNLVRTFWLARIGFTTPSIHGLWGPLNTS
jgi:hypothetical protein